MCPDGVTISGKSPSLPPLFNRRYIETRLGYRIQELTHGGLKPETVRRLQELGEQLDGGNITTRRIRTDLKPIIGTRLIREWQGTEHCVTVTRDGFEWQGRPYKSLSAIARTITGESWSGPRFFGLVGATKEGGAEGGAASGAKPKGRSRSTPRQAAAA